MGSRTLTTTKSKKTKFSIGYFAIALALLWLIQPLIVEPLLIGRQEETYDKFRKHLADGRITEVTIKPERIFYRVKKADAGETSEASAKDMKTEQDDTKAKPDDDQTELHNVVRLDHPTHSHIPCLLVLVGPEFANHLVYHFIASIPASKLYFHF